MPLGQRPGEFLGDYSIATRIPPGLGLGMYDILVGHYSWWTVFLVDDILVMYYCCEMLLLWDIILVV